MAWSGGLLTRFPNGGAAAAAATATAAAATAAITAAVVVTGVQGSLDLAEWRSGVLQAWMDGVCTLAVEEVSGFSSKESLL